MIAEIRRYRSSFKNWPSVTYKMYTGRDTIKCELKSGTVIETDKELVSFLSYFLELGVIDDNQVSKVLSDGILEFSYASNNVLMKVYDRERKMPLGDLLPIFFKNDYKFLTQGTQTLVDVGANIGDSSIYFALNGISHIIALEPYPFSFKIAQHNIKVNKLSDHIDLINAAYGNDGTIEIEDKANTPGSDLVHYNGGITVDVMSLRTLIGRYGLEKENMALKMDCEGCEYNLVSEGKDILSLFKKIQIEYHYGVKDLGNILSKSGFKVKATSPVKSYNPSSSSPEMQVGFIYAERQIE